MAFLFVDPDTPEYFNDEYFGAPTAAPAALAPAAPTKPAD